jgi:hypothetical protein
MKRAETTYNHAETGGGARLDVAPWDGVMRFAHIA